MPQLVSVTDFVVMKLQAAYCVRCWGCISCLTFTEGTLLDIDRVVLKLFVVKLDAVYSCCRLGTLSQIYSEFNRQKTGYLHHYVFCLIHMKE